MRNLAYWLLAVSWVCGTSPTDCLQCHGYVEPGLLIPCSVMGMWNLAYWLLAMPWVCGTWPTDSLAQHFPGCVIRGFYSCTCVPHREGNPMGGSPLFNIAVPNWWGWCWDKASIELEIDQGFFVWGLVCDPLNHYFTWQITFMDATQLQCNMKEKLSSPVSDEPPINAHLRPHWQNTQFLSSANKSGGVVHEIIQSGILSLQISLQIWF